MKDLKELNEIVARAKLAGMRARRQEMIDWLITQRKFNPKGAVTCVDNFLDSMAYVIEETGGLP